MPKMTELALRARSLADLEQSKAISYEDVVNSANESWRTVYNELMNSNDDYYIKDTTFTNISAYLIPDMQNQYLIPLPSDCYKIRTVDYYDGTGWTPMSRLPLNMRDVKGSEPRYRIQANNLFVNIGAGVQMPAKIKVTYYPPADLITMPEDPIVYGSAVIPSLFSTIKSPFYIPATYYPNSNVKSYDQLVYFYNGAIVAESFYAATNTTLLTVANASYITYYKGYLYWIQSGDIIKASYTPGTTTTLIPTTIVTDGTIQSLSIMSDTLYYATSAATFTAALDGTSPVSFQTFVANDVCKLGSSFVWILQDGSLQVSGTTVLSNIVSVDSDGTNLYVLDSSSNLRKISVASGVVTEDVTLMTGVKEFGNYSDYMLSITTVETLIIEAISSEVDFDFSYPLNVLYEWISYQMATDFKRKYDSNNTDLDARKNVIWATFLDSVIRRDEYKYEKIQNVYQDRTGLYY